MWYRGCCLLSAGTMCIGTVWLHLRVWCPSQIERNHKYMREDWICTLLGVRVASLHSCRAHLPYIVSISICCTHRLPSRPTPFLQMNLHAGWIPKPTPLFYTCRTSVPNMGASYLPVCKGSVMPRRFQAIFGGPLPTKMRHANLLLEIYQLSH